MLFMGKGHALVPEGLVEIYFIVNILVISQNYERACSHQKCRTPE